VLKQVTGRKFSKAGQRIIIFTVIIIALFLLIFLLVRPAQKPLNTPEPLGVPNQTK
jgi:uncharacterized protein YpmB